MAKAKVKMPGGITVRLDGTPDEILRVVRDLEKKGPKSSGQKPPKPGRLTLPALFDSLVEDGFFKQPRDLGAIRAELETRGHHYPVTSLSGAALGAVRKRSLRRLKKEDRWFYTR